MKNKIRLSQCMIVKNEEENIVRALTWGKDIMYEQIVVDTGSTDRTVEIAKKMGAKVYHFAWINDFSAAKNFAIEQATGNWIAFLDADEYFLDDDVKKIIPLLLQIEEQRRKLKIPLLVKSALANLDDNGKVSSMASHTRLFSNVSKLRYHKRIHEHLLVSGRLAPEVFDASNQLTIYHTGYSWKAYEKTRKLQRNISLLEKEVEENPENYDSWAYLGDSLMADKQLKRAEEVYRRVIDHIDTIVLQERKDMVFSNLIKLKYYYGNTNEQEILDIYNKSIENNCLSPDIEFWLGRWLLNEGNTKIGAHYMELALSNLEHYKKDGVLDIMGDLPYAYGSLFHAHKQLNNLQEAVRYGTLYLRAEPYGEEILMKMIGLFKGTSDDNDTTEAILGFLSKLYDFSVIKNKLYLIRVSRKLLYKNMEKKVYNLFTPEERKYFDTNENDVFQNL